MSHIPRDLSAHTLRDLFNKYGTCDVELGKTSEVALATTNEYYAYVNYYSLESAQRAVSDMNGGEISGHRLTVKLQGANPTPPHVISPTSCTVKVTNVSKYATESNLTEIFSFSGSINLASVKLNSTSSPFNYAYVNYSNSIDAERAVVELNGCRTRDGVKLQVKLHGAASSAVPQGVSDYNADRPQSSSVKVMLTDGSPSEDELHDFFSQFGELREKPIIRKGAPDFTYINFKHEIGAKNVSKYTIGNTEIRPGIIVRIRPPRNVVSRAFEVKPASNASTLFVPKLVVCDTVTSRLLTSSDPMYVKHRESIAPVEITLPKKGGGVTLFGEQTKLAAAESYITLLIKDIQRDISQKMLRLPCMYIPAFSNPATVSSIAEIEQKLSVEFLVCINSTSQHTQDIATFLNVVSTKLASQTAAEITCLDRVLEQGDPSDFLPKESSPGQPSSFVWSWENDQGGYTEYDPASCADLNKEYKSSPQGTFHRMIPTKLGTTTYTINFATMIQTNSKTGNSRGLRKAPKGLVSTAKWLYKGDTKKSEPYSPSECQEIETMYTSKTPAILTIKGRMYMFDFTRMKQTNIETLYERDIERQVTQTTPQSGNCNVFTLKISGLEQSIKNAEYSLTEEMGKAILDKTHRLPLSALADSTFQADLIGTLQKYFVWPQLVGDCVQVRGIQGYIEKVLLILREKILDHEKEVLARNPRSVHGGSVPDHWEPQSERITLKDVRRRSPEWNELERRVYETLPSAQIKSIQRIQNQWLWEKYTFSKQRMSERNNGNVNEKKLFHGTRGTQPEKIFKSEQGFDFRFSSQGLWGTGTYFAVNASYSDRYTYSSASGKQMILALVLTGETHRCQSDGSLKKPPVKPQTKANTTFEDERYDSVSGHTNGSDVFIIYDHEKAYPSYLITYS